MTWIIAGVTLPIEPRSVKKKTLRTQKAIPLVNDFPDPVVAVPTKYQMQIQGFIWPRALAIELDEATRHPENEEVEIAVLDDSGVTITWLSGDYSVGRSSIDRDRPLYEGSLGGEVYEYTITFQKFAELGTDETGDEGGPGSDEDTGFFDLPDDIGFDADGDGDVDASEIFNWLVNIMTFGVFK